MLVLQIAQRLCGRAVREVGMDAQYGWSIRDGCGGIRFRRAQVWVEGNDATGPGMQSQQGCDLALVDLPDFLLVLEVRDLRRRIEEAKPILIERQLVRNQRPSRMIVHVGSS